MQSNPVIPGTSPPAVVVKLDAAFSKLQRSYRAAADKAVAHVGLSHALARPLMSIGRLGGGVRHGVVAESLGVESPSLVRSIDHLVQAGLAERREDAADARARTLHLTPAGTQAWEQIEAALDAFRTHVFAGIPEAELAACLRVFDALGQTLGCEVPELPAKR
jgi:MarR family transcriptional regulator for hemolysin